MILKYSKKHVTWKDLHVLPHPHQISFAMKNLEGVKKLDKKAKNDDDDKI